MKWCFGVFVICALTWNACSAERHERKPLTIAALFHEDEADLAMAFKYAVQRRNLFDRIQFKAEVQFVQRQDTFSTHKIICNLVKRGVVGIVGPTSLKTSCMAQSIAETLEIPHIQVQWKTSKPIPDIQNLTINYYPDQNTLSMGIATILKHMEWNKYVILYENQDGLVRMQEVLKLVGQEKVVVMQLIGPDYRTVFKTLKAERIQNFIIDCTEDILEQVLRDAKELMMLDFGYGFFLTNLNSHTVDISKFGNKANVTTIRILDPESPAVTNVIRDWEVGESLKDREMHISRETLKTEAALMDDAIMHFTESISELYVTEPIESKPLSCEGHETWNDGIRIASYMRVHPKIRSITGNMTFDYMSGRRTEFVLEIIEYADKKYEKSCEWYTNPHFSHTINCTRTAGSKKQSILEHLQKETVLVSSRLEEPFLVRRQSKYIGELVGNAQYEGYAMDLIDAIATNINFTYLFVIVNGTNDDLIQGLLERKAHMAICDLTITHKRRALVDFSMPFMTLGIGILYRKAKESETALFAFMDPLETEVWIYIVTFYISITGAMYLIARMAPGDWEKPHPCDQNPEELENIWTLKNCLWLILGSTMSQGCDILPKGISSRMATAMWWFFILIINSSYTANLAAFLTKDRMGTEIDSAEALAAQTKVKYGTVEGLSTQAFFRNSKNKLYQKMWTAMSQAKPSVFEKGNPEGVKRVLNAKNQGYAFFMESTLIDFVIERNCSLKQVGTRLDNKGYGIAMPMNSPYRSAINEEILKLQEAGTLKKLYTRWWKEKLGAGQCQNEEASSSTSAASWNISNVIGVFMVLGIGVGVAFVFAICEFLWNVREVSLQEHITFYDAFKIEIKFATNVWVTEKRVKPEIPERKESEDRERSIAAKVLHGATSIIKLDVFEKKLI